MTTGWNLVLLLNMGAVAFGADLERAQKLYDRTEYTPALEILAKSTEPRNGAAWELAGKANFQLREFKKAIEAFSKATQIEPKNSRYYNWLGRAWGRRAEAMNPLVAAGYASDVRGNLERAVELDGKNQEAVSDLLDYYLAAPALFGGGIDKAMALAEKSKSNNAAEYHSLLARIAERQKQYEQAESQLRQAVTLAPKDVGRAVDLAMFLSRRGKYNESDATFQQASKVEPDNRLVLYARAEAYIAAKRNLSSARDLLQQYLRSALTPDDPSREEARRLLKRASGD